MTDDYRSYDVHLLLQDHITPEQRKWRNRTQPDGIWTAVGYVLLIEAVAGVVICAAVWWDQIVLWARGI